MFETEDALVDNFVETTDPSYWTRSGKGDFVRSVFESDCSDGRADWVWARSTRRWPRNWCDQTVEVMQNPTCSRVLACLRLSSPRTEKFLRDKLGVGDQTFRTAVSNLISAKLIRQTSDELYLLTPKLNLPDVEICAFEFKLVNWKRAFFQATRYRSFAHRVYVVLPTQVIDRTEKLWDSFRMQNIGLIAHDLENGTRRILPSRKRSPRSRSNFLQALGMIHQWSN